jgi:hypothetical protein
VRTVARALLPPFALLALANGLRNFPPFYGPYLAATAAVLAFALDTGAFRLERLQGWPRAAAAAGLGLLATASVALVPWLILRPPPLALALPALAVLLISPLNAALELRGLSDPRARDWTAARFALSLAAAGLVLLGQAAGGVQLWEPSWPLGR